MPLHRLTTLPCVAIAAAAFLSTVDAAAATVPRLFATNGGTACTGALPTFEGALRKRPMAIVNEGAASAFVTCSMEFDDLATLPTSAFLRATNFNAVAVTVTCTLVNGNEHQGSAAYPQTFTVSAGGAFIAEWSAPSRKSLNFSCNLPPGAGISYVGRTVDEAVGN